MPWLLDTNILSEIRRLKPEPKVLAFVAGRRLDELYVSAVTLAELRFGIERLDAGGRREELRRWLTQMIRPMFDQRMVPVTEDILFRWCVLMEDGRKTGIPIRSRTSSSPRPPLNTGLRSLRAIGATSTRRVLQF